MSGEESFHVNPDTLHRGKALLAELGSLAWAIKADFDAAMADTSFWGHDENGRKYEKWDVANRDGISRSIEAAAVVLERSGDATLLNLNATSSTQNDILDGIDEEIDSYDIGGDGGSDGGRRG
ncbi:hypothetical protein [Streptomyces sp. SudanB66_2053]|uniref:hypothetical protein n=1 Tax=Streptomyces sp. SudanB66_2053 TaxID=3035277 RepID=UPI003F57C7ED